MKQLMKRVFIEHSNKQYEDMWIRFGFKVVNNLLRADVVQFTGGADVGAKLYGHSQHQSTHSDSNRDTREISLYKYCVGHRIPMVGICRGAQFLNVMNGGEMYQDVSNHTRDHLAYTALQPEGIKVSSTHHQMMKPDLEGMYTHLLMWADENSRKLFYDTETKDFIEKMPDKKSKPTDIEAVWYSNTNSLCFQPHPEFSGYDDCRKTLKYFINNYTFGEI